MPDHYDILFRSINLDDYEERSLLEKLRNMEAESVRREMTAFKTSKPSKSAIDAEAELKASLLTKLGYDPAVGRASRPRGRPKAGSIPSPLPPVGTVLKSCLGSEYIIHGYAWAPARVTGDPTYVLYSYDGVSIARNLVNLFAGTLASGEPIVTWPEDPRGLKPGVEVPLKFRRQLTREQLKADREANDQDLIQHEQGRHRRY